MGQVDTSHLNETLSIKLDTSVISVERYIRLGFRTLLQINLPLTITAIIVMNCPTEMFLLQLGA